LRVNRTCCCTEALAKMYGVSDDFIAGHEAAIQKGNTAKRLLEQATIRYQKATQKRTEFERAMENVSNNVLAKELEENLGEKGMSCFRE